MTSAFYLFSFVFLVFLFFFSCKSKATNTNIYSKLKDIEIDKEQVKEVQKDIQKTEQNRLKGNQKIKEFKKMLKKNSIQENTYRKMNQSISTLFSQNNSHKTKKILIIAYTKIYPEIKYFEYIKNMRNGFENPKLFSTIMNIIVSNYKDKEIQMLNVKELFNIKTKNAYILLNFYQKNKKKLIQFNL